MLCAAHSDSPCFKIKEGGCIAAEKRYVKLNVEKYGGMIMAPWFDRPLSVAGRLICKARGRHDGQDGGAGNALELEQHLVNIERDLVMIPNLAIHMSKDAPSANGFNVQENMLPILSCGDAAQAENLNTKSFVMYRMAKLYNSINDFKNARLSAEYALILNPRNAEARLLLNKIKGRMSSFESMRE